MLEAVEDRRVFDFRDLEVWKKAFEISIHIHKASLEFPKIEQYALASQIRRASKGICANIAEGFGKQQTSKAEFKRFLMIALGSANEMIVWLKYCEKLGYESDQQVKKWVSEYQSICKMLNSLHGKI